MILHVATTAPWALREIADAALGLHIGGAFAGLAAGTVALVARKGQRLHRLAGNVFLFAMMAMAGVGAVVAPMMNDMGSTFAGAITVYLVITGWRAGRPGEVKGGPFEMAGVALLGVAIATLLVLGRQALASPAQDQAGVPAFAFFVMATVAALIGALDLKVILGPVLTRPQKLARHIWRMGLGLLIALMSGLAQQKVGGVIFHGHAALQWIPVGALVLTIAYWLVRVRRPARRAGRPSRPVLGVVTQGVFQ